MVCTLKSVMCQESIQKKTQGPIAYQQVARQLLVSLLEAVHTDHVKVGEEYV